MSTTCICVLNYNQGEKTIRCLSTIFDQTLQDYRVIVIDNHSDDDSMEVICSFLRKREIRHRFLIPGDNGGNVFMTPGEILILRSERNAGYSSGNNLGIRLAGSAGIFDFILILNNDTRLKKDFLEELVKRFHEVREINHSDKIALGATEIGNDGKVHHTGFHYLQIPTGLTYSAPAVFSFRYIVGSAIFLPARAPRMDESFFLYFDDVQYSRILLRNGYILESSPRSVFYHETGGTEMKNRYKQIFKSLRRFYFLNYPYLLPMVIPFRWLLNLWLRFKSGRTNPGKNPA